MNLFYLGWPENPPVRWVSNPRLDAHASGSRACDADARDSVARRFGV